MSERGVGVCMVIPQDVYVLEKLFLVHCKECSPIETLAVARLDS